MLQVYKLLFLLSIFGLASFYMEAKDAPHYAVDKIPAELKKNANAVIRVNDIHYEIISPERARQEIKYAITVLKEGALEMSLFTEMYDKFIRVNEISGTIYDAKGKRVKRIKNEDIIDRSAFDGFSLFTDNRLKLIDPEYMNYPFTIEYTYSVDYKSLFFMPSFYLFNGYNIAVESSNYIVKVPSEYDFRYKEVKIKNSPIIKNEDDAKVYSWKLDNFKALNNEPYSPHYTTIYPCIITQPSLFEFDGYTGDFKSWNEFGKFIYSLNKDKDILPDETQQEILKLIEGANNEAEKVARIYQYAQKKNRYISIQVGIGGYQPFPAETVDRLSYGDCKALSNYTKALLKVAGIEARYTLVHAGTRKRPVDIDFPANKFNHAILCVPLVKDTIWLECTSATSPCGYFGDFTDDRNVLIIEENSGKLIKTPMYSAEKNRQAINSTVRINADNGLLVNAEIKYTGAQYGDEYYLIYRDEKDRRKSVINSIDIANFKLLNYDLIDNRESTPVFTKKLELEATNYCTKMGDKTLLKLNVFNASDYVPRFVRNRQNPVYIQRNYSECDTIRFEIPENLKVEALPKAINLETEYGQYSCKAELADDQIIYYRYFQINKGEYPKEAYEPFREFLEKAANADNAKTMLVPKS